MDIKTEIGTTRSDAISWIDDSLGRESTREIAERVFDALCDSGEIDFESGAYYLGDISDDRLFELAWGEPA